MNGPEFDPPAPVTAAEVSERLVVLHERIDAAGGRGRTKVLAVTKTFPLAVAEVAASVGLLDLGENYAQELVAKADALERSDVRWHMIGGLQRNKVKKLVGRADVFQTVDRAELVSEIAKRVPGATVFIQVNTTSESQKSGCAPDEAAGLVDQGRRLGLDVVGLMTIGPTDGNDPRPAFAALRNLGERLHLAELSMGMSGDLEAAVEEGSTMVRVGTALFGPRPRRQ